MALPVGFIEIRTIRNSAGTRALIILRRPDGFFGYIGERLMTEDNETFWEPADFSSIYQSVEDAERSALGEIDWLSGENSN